MIKNSIILLLFVCVTHIQAQKYITKSGLTDFKGSVEAFEPVEAVNESTTVLLNSENGTIAALLFIHAFRFDIALMQEHFHENYMDSDTFPKATFKGRLLDFDSTSLTEKVQTFKLKGVLNIRGIDKTIETNAKVKRLGDVLVLKGAFTVLPQDFGIDIPKIVRKKIAEQIHIKLHYELVKK
ncbi:YceI family protein [Seonamhaeicola sp.]|uniref:YceI family protein n=1 Tax=Seonamhaeicola sp. TaxID=1912245 RepID=UPI00262BAB5F|nr:YceI family protein [Seonamhaeicola sp.]